MKQQEITLEEKWDKILEIDVEEQTLQVVADINEFNHEALEDILHYNNLPYLLHGNIKEIKHEKK